MEPIGKISGFKIKDNGLIANVKINDTLKYKVIKNIYDLEDRILFIEFKRVAIVQLINEFEQINCPLTAQSLRLSLKKIDKEIKYIKKSIKNLSSIL